MFSKWIIEGIDGFVFGEDKKLYKLPYCKGNRSYGLREIKMQYCNRYKINGVWWSQAQLKNKIKIDPKPVRLIDKKMPY